MSYGPSPFPPAPPEVPPTPTGQGLHPLTVGRTFELAWRMFRFRWRSFLGAAAIFLAPFYVVDAIVQSVTAPVFGRWALDWQEWLEDQMGTLENGPGAGGELTPFPPFPPGLAEAMAFSLVLGIVSILVLFLATAAVVRVAGRTYEGAPASARESALLALRRSPSLLGAVVLVYLALFVVGLVGFGVGLGLVLQGAGLAAFAGVLLMVTAFVVLVFLSIRWAFAQQAIMLEGRGALEGLGRSWRLVAGSNWRVLGYVLLMAIVVGLLATVLLAVIELVLTRGSATLDPTLIAVRALLYGAVNVMFLPFSTAYFTLLYFDLRWRKGEMSGVAAGGAPAVTPYGGQPPYGNQPPYGGQPPG